MTKMAPVGAPPGTKDDPIFFRFLRDDEDRIDVKKIVVMLALTVLSGYLATQAQRVGSSPDQLKVARMRYHLAARKVASGQAAFWTQIARHHEDLYEIARL